jgi:hypothetical protein
MASDTKFFLIIVACFVAGFSMLIALVEVGDYLYDKNLACPRFAENIERPYKYDWFAGGCFVQTATGQWVAEKNYWNNPVLSH